MRSRYTLAGLTLVAALAPTWSQAQSFTDNLMLRARAVGLFWDNGQTGAVQSLDVKAKDKVIPEVDLTYFFSPNLAAELVLTYPQKVDVEAGSSDLGSVKALPPTLLLQYHFTEGGAFKPYVGAGLNYTIFSDRSNLGGGAYSVESSSVGLAAQVGMDYMFDKNWGVNVDFKYIKISTDVSTTSNGATVGELELTPWAVGVGVTYRF